MSNEVPQAEGPNRSDEGDGTGPAARESNPGARPHRMRGFYRAVRRGEPWAVKIDQKRGLARGLALMWRRIDWQRELKKPSWLDHIEKAEPWVGGTLVVPFPRTGKA